MQTYAYHLTSITDTETLAHQISLLVRKGDVIELRGDLGVGKTAFAQAFISSLLPTPETITSPTFNIVHIYETASFPIWHVDLYRITSPNELPELGLYESFSTSVTLIEWPEIIEDQLPHNRLSIYLQHGQNERERKATLVAHGHWQERLKLLSSPPLKA